MLTAMVGVKRHHTRFYPMNAADADVRGNNNCHPGTWVDRGVTLPYFQDFYLQSHSGIKGTARPTHYFTLVNGLIKSCRGTEELRKLVSTPISTSYRVFQLTYDTQTHLLCYTYCRATTGVSYATPTYYADRLCDRVRLYLPNTWTGGDINFETQLNSAQNTVLHGRQHARDVIYRNGQAFDAQAGHVKTHAEKADEAGDAEAVRLAARQVVLEYAQQEFYSARQADANAIASAANPTAVAPRITTGNPWHDNVAKTMFWM
jgi:eukaryotic translation initiation factor 2C